MENNNISFGKNLRRIRLEKGLTQTELGNKVGLSKRMIAHYEKHVKMPPTDKIVLLAKALHTSADSLLQVTPDELEKENNLDTTFARKLEKSKKLPDEDKIFLSSMIDNLIRKNDMQIKRPRKKTK